LEGGGEGAHVVALGGGVDRELALLLRPFDELLRAVGLVVGGDLRHGAAGLRLCRRGPGERSENQPCGDCERVADHSASFFSFPPLRKSSIQSFSQRSFSSSVITGSIMWNGNLLRRVSTERLAGTRLRSRISVWPSFESM